MTHTHDHAHDHESNPDQELWSKWWRGFLLGDPYEMMELPWMMKAMHLVERKLFSIIPANPRCQECSAPFKGLGGKLLGPLGYTQSDLTTRLCNACLTPLKTYQGGAEIELSMLFADIRGSTTLAEQIGPTEFQKVINRFYRATSDVLVKANALVDRLVGDEIIGLFVPGFAGKDHARVAVETAQELLRVTGHGDPDGPWIPVGAGVHTGIAYLGAVGSADGLADITALGDSVNTTARLASSAAPGEILISHETIAASGLEMDHLEHRLLNLKGRSEPVDVQVFRVAATA
jgi:adenylate cyclase